MSETNDTTSLFEIPLFRISFSCSLLALEVLGLVVYFLVVLAIWRCWKELAAARPFYILVLHLAASDMSMMAVFLLFMHSALIYGSFLSQEQWEALSFPFSYLNFFFFQTSVLLLILISLNRFFSFFFRKANHRLFSEKSVKKTAACAWAIAAIRCIIQHTTDCTLLYDRVYMDPIINKSCIFELVYTFLLSQLTPLLLFFLNLILFVHLRRKHRNSVVPREQQQSRKIEMRMLQQAGLISAALLWMSIVYFIGFLFFSEDVLWTLFHFASLFNYWINPMVYLRYNKIIRKEFLVLLGKMHQRSVTASGATTTAQ